MVGSIARQQRELAAWRKLQAAMAPQQQLQQQQQQQQVLQQQQQQQQTATTSKAGQPIRTNFCIGMMDPDAPL